MQSRTRGVKSGVNSRAPWEDVRFFHGRPEGDTDFQSAAAPIDEHPQETARPTYCANFLPWSVRIDMGIFTEGWNWTLRCLEKPLQKRIATYHFVNSVLIIRRKWCAECSNVFPEPAKFALSIRTQARPGRAVRTFGSFLLTSIAPGITRNGSWSTAPEAVSQPINGGAACFCSYKRDPLYA